MSIKEECRYCGKRFASLKKHHSGDNACTRFFNNVFVCKHCDFETEYISTFFTNTHLSFIKVGQKSGGGGRELFPVPRKKLFCK